MSQPLNVDPIELFMSSDHLDMRQSQHSYVHELANAALESAGGGWVGNSAAALQGKLSDLHQISAHIENELGHHRDVFRKIGHAYSDIDEQSAADLIRIRQSV
ncbi:MULTISPECIES: WXG100 family type VII secretion target [unclassified Mycolicibacterium]|uniref:WXG100 family type VII secretion target n=1 Tax=unclassified Mycolicibacterium TaxID=2636767 RepID=UPI002ED900BC